MLLVAEILFAIWFYKSQSSIERTIAGSILALVFICLMIFVLRMNRTELPTKKKHKCSFYEKNYHSWIS
jgi:F0F1-type ATP synthase assembly protein I